MYLTKNYTPNKDLPLQTKLLDVTKVLDIKKK